MRIKILPDREPVAEHSYFERDFSSKEIKGMATCIVGGCRIWKASYLKKYAEKLIENGLEKNLLLEFFTSDEPPFPFSYKLYIFLSLSSLIQGVFLIVKMEPTAFRQGSAHTFLS